MFLYYCCIIDVSINSMNSADGGNCLEPAITSAEIYADFTDSASDFIEIAEKLVMDGYMIKKQESNSGDTEYFLTAINHYQRTDPM